MEKSVKSLKKELRKLINSRLNNLPPLYRKKCSYDVFEQVVQLQCYQKSSAIFCYLSMPQEIQTRNFIDKCFKEGKRIFVPKISGRNSCDMQVLEVNSMKQIDNFPKNNWGIPEPPKQEDDSWKVSAHTAIDLVIVPGVGFDSTCNRLGHGKGYYDSFLQSCENYCKEKNKKRPSYVGVAYDEQIEENIPITDHDIILDFVVTPSELYSRSVDDGVSTCTKKRSREVEDGCTSGNACNDDEISNSTFPTIKSGESSSKKKGWVGEFVKAAKIGNAGDECLADFMPSCHKEKAGSDDVGGFRQPSNLASFVSRTRVRDDSEVKK